MTEGGDRAALLTEIAALRGALARSEAALLDTAGDRTALLGATELVEGLRRANAALERGHAALLESESRGGFLLALADRLRPIGDPAGVMAATSEAVGRHLGAGRCGFGEVDPTGAFLAVERDWTAGAMASVAGRHRTADLGPGVADACRAGRAVVIPDASADARAPGSGPPFGPAPGEGGAAGDGPVASLAVPLLREGRWVAVLFVQEARPRAWTPEEERIVREAADRGWEAVGRARLAAALRESEARFRALVTAGSYLIYRMSPDWRRMYQLVGREFLSDTPEPVEDWADHYIPPEDRPTVMAAVAAAIRDDALFDLVHRVRRADGGVGWVHSRAVPIRGPTGAIVEWFGAGSDVTESRNAAAALRESEERFRAFAENSADTIWIASGDGTRLEYLSPAFERMFGEARATIMADLRRWADLVHPEDRATAVSYMPRTLAGETAIVHYRVVRPDDGATVWLRDTGFPIRDAAGAVTRVAGIVQDVTDIERAVAALGAEKDRFRILLEGIPQIVWRGAAGGHWTWSSPQWTAFTGLAEAESRGLGWLAALHPDDREAALAAWRRAGARTAFAAEYRLRHAATGRYHWFQTRATPVRDARGAVLEWFGTSTDVDELRRLQEHQALLLAELQHRVRNTLGVIRSVARRTAGTSGDVEEYATHLDGRIGALARVQAAVTRAPARGLDLAQLLADELLAHSAREDGAVRIEGPELRLRPKAAETLGLAFHELTTNAVKYGALSVPEGRIAVTWRVGPRPGGGGPGERPREQPEEREGGPWLLLDWVESGVPAPLPSRRGFGTELLERTLSYEMEAEVRQDYQPGGLRCRIALPLTGRTLPDEAGPPGAASADAGSTDGRANRSSAVTPTGELP